MDPDDRTQRLTLLWTEAQPAVFGFIYSLVTNFTDAEEVLQRVALAIVKNFDNYDEKRPFNAWAFGIARNQAKYFIRQKTTDRHVFSEDVMELVSDAYESVEDEFQGMHGRLLDCLK